MLQCKIGKVQPADLPGLQIWLWSAQHPKHFEFITKFLKIWVILPKYLKF